MRVSIFLGKLLVLKVKNSKLNWIAKSPTKSRKINLWENKMYKRVNWMDGVVQKFDYINFTNLNLTRCKYKIYLFNFINTWYNG